MSLKAKLNQKIKDAYPGMVSINETETFTKALGYRISNGERRLRELAEGEYPTIRIIRNSKGNIRGYAYLPQNAIVDASKSVEPIYRTKQREEQERRDNSPQKQLL